MAHYWLRRSSEEQKSLIKSPRRSSSADRELESPKLEGNKLINKNKN